MYSCYQECRQLLTRAPVKTRGQLPIYILHQTEMVYQWEGHGHGQKVQYPLHKTPLVHQQHMHRCFSTY